jgi:hypothetical protein
MNTKNCFLAALLLLAMPAFAQKEKTSFQIAEKWRPEYDVRADVAIMYGMDSTFHERAQSWKEKGYRIQFMTGIAWGEYQDYFKGKFDGKTHFEEGQKDVSGNIIWHGPEVPYIVPTESYINYIKSHVKKAIDEGVTAIYLEEPEFWAFGGYEEPFKKAWQDYYGFKWMPQDSTAEATYLSSKLKYQMFFNALKEVFLYVKDYSKGAVKCFVPTHSLLNYASWHIVSPEASLAQLPGMDGYIAQVWTGTSRVPNYFNGVRRERVFENAYLEYNTLYSMIAPTKKQVYFLTDPIEDGVRSWDDYKVNYQATFTAKLLYPRVDQYEVMPWPNRIYLGKFKMEGSAEAQPISPAYATQMQVMVNSLNDMPLSNNKVSGTQGIGILLGNSLMFQRFPTHKGYEDPQLSNWYGMVLPLLKRGIPVQTIHMENLGFADALKDTKVLIMSYADMKPFAASVHEQLAAWVRKGGVLVYEGRDDDPFQDVQEWWNTKGNHFKAASEDLFKQLGITPTEGNAYKVGRGTVYVVRKDPKEQVMEPAQDKAFVDLIKTAYLQSGGKNWQMKNSFYLERGPFTIAAVMDENADTTALTIQEPVIDLFDPALPVLSKKVIQPGEQAYLYALKRRPVGNKPAVLCAAARVTSISQVGRKFFFTATGPLLTNNVMRVSLPGQPLKVKEGIAQVWDKDSKTLLLKFPNSPDGVKVEITY